MKLTLEINRRLPQPWKPPRHPQDRDHEWIARPAPVLELHLPWGPDEPGNWHPRRWRIRLNLGDRSWPCVQIGLGPLYLRAWWPGTTIYWSHHEPVLMSLSRTERS